MKKKITLPKTSQVRSVLYQFERFDFSNFDFAEFLKNKESQESFFLKKDLTIYEILFYVWSSRYVEKDLIKKGEIEENHPFFNRFLKIMDLNPASKDSMLEFCTLMYFEDNSICQHWNFKEKLTKENFDKLVFKNIYESSRCFNVFLKNLTNEEFSNIKFISSKHPERPALDIKSKVMKDILYSHGATRTSRKKVLSMINQDLNVTPNYEVLFQHINKSTIFYYALQHLNTPDFNTALVKHKINGVNMEMTVENLSKYNSMDKGLSECLQRKYGYGIDGKMYDIKEFKDLIYHFAQDPFLKKVIVKFLYEKSSKAVKKENKATWQYYAILLDVNENDKEKQKEERVTKRLKI